jgi:hypothetical protein
LNLSERGKEGTFYDFTRGIAYRESLFLPELTSETKASIDSDIISLSGVSSKGGLVKTLPNLHYGSSLSQDLVEPELFRDLSGRCFNFSQNSAEFKILKYLSERWPRFATWRDMLSAMNKDEGTAPDCVEGLLVSEMIIPAVEPPQYEEFSQEVTSPRWLNWQLVSSGVLTNRLYEAVELEGFESMLLEAISGGMVRLGDLVKLTVMQLSKSPEHRDMTFDVIREAVVEAIRTLSRASLINEVIGD